MKKGLTHLKSFFDRLHHEKDRFLFIFIAKYWPRFITPNQLTVTRIVISVLLVFFMANIERFRPFILPVFLIGALTDLLDGAVARCLKQITRFGEIVDPLADRLLILPVAFFLLMVSHQILLFLILISEIFNSLITLFAMKRRIPVETNIFGKIKMFLQSVALLGMLLFLPGGINTFFIDVLWLSLVFMLMAIIYKLINIFESQNAQPAHL